MVAELFKQILPNSWPTVIGDLPSTKTDAIGILEYDGATSTEYFGKKDSSSIFEPIVKIVFRCNSYEKGHQWAQETKQTLHRYHDDTLLSVLMVGSPMYLGRTPEKLHEFQVTFRTQVKE